MLKAIGFSDRAVLFFVLAESLMISLFGGLLGLRPAPWSRFPFLASALNGLVARLDSRRRIDSRRWACGCGRWSESSAVCCRASARCACASLTRCGGSELAIPLIYNVRSVKARWTSTIVAVLGIAGTVGVFVAMLSLARGFQSHAGRFRLEPTMPSSCAPGRHSRNDGRRYA